ncbi:MAG: DUF2723 domain-containing protein, partial [Bacteroidales bacterium]|nr:DUF2723 domain-containing protein [Bacteroidales bacterium]
MKDFRLYNNIAGWGVFVIATLVYLVTIESTASFWDCGEFIAASYKMQVGHPPGAPLFLLFGRIFSLFAGGNAEFVPVMINALSALASSFTVLFLFWTISHLALKITGKKEVYTPSELIIVLGSALTGSLSYAFSDTFWFSAAEGEVYASSSLFTALVFWAILKWENVAGEKAANRWLVLIAYLMGLSIGVHLLNLLAIPAIVLIYYFKTYKISRRGVFYALVVAIAILASIMYVLLPGLVQLATWVERITVNTFGVPYW